MRSPFTLLARLVNGHPVIVAGLLLAVVVVSLYGTTQIAMETGSAGYLDKNTPFGQNYDTYTSTFSSDVIILLVETDDSTGVAELQFLDRLSQDVRSQANVQSVASIADLIKQANGGRIPTSAAEVIAIKNAIPRSLLERYVPSNTFTMIQVVLDTGLSKEQGRSVLNNIQSLVSSTDLPPGTTVSVTGSTAFSKQMGDEMSKSTGTLIGVAMVLMVIVMGLLFGYVSHRFLPVLIVAMGLIITFGVMGLAGVKITMAAIGAFPILIGLGIDYAIQFQARLEEEARKGPLVDAVRETMENTAPAVFYAMFATAMGFAALFLSPVPMIGGFALVSIIGIASCYAVSLIGIPCFARLVNYTPKGVHQEIHEATGYDRFLGTLSVRIAKNPLPLLAVVGAVALIGVALDPHIPISTDENTFVPQDMPALVLMEKATRTMGSTESVPILVRGDAVDSLDSLAWMLEFEDYVLRHHSDRLIGGKSIADLVVQYNGGRLPSSQAELDRVLTLIPAATKAQYLSGHGTAQIAFTSTQMDVPAQAALKRQLEEELAFLSPPPGISAQPTGSFALFTKLIGDISENKDRMTVLGFVLVLSVLLFVYRKINAAAPLIPIVAVVGWNAVAMTLLGIDYTPLTATLGSMTIGVAAEYTILVLERFLEERERTPDVFAAIEHSVQKIGRAITVSGLATAFGFSALCASTFPMIANFGVTTVIAVAFSLIGAIVVMPAALVVVDRVQTWIDARRSPGPVPAA
ncbi:MAG TPA: hydrophobe/amphiphile efflux-3 (HAE3) family transporter [Methanoregulaceae archaeon]|nr:hydrophobe/amphiphile efflux-3 (HAE3) family transporter [Methanoregulaceae archaeon]HQJ87115.1 hydrophobe/amphiphile efflux-3 (HAE3) family transporter [Methanoregulaceae archaeon]